MRSNNIIITEPLNYRPRLGPFQFAQSNFIDHPIQPNDEISIDDQTIKTFNRSKLSQSQSPHLLNLKPNSLEQSMYQEGSSLVLAFSRFLQDTPKIKPLSKRIVQKMMSFVRPQLNGFQKLYDEELEEQVFFQLKMEDNSLRVWNIIYLIYIIFVQACLPFYLNAIFLVFRVIDILVVLMSQYQEGDQVIKDQVGIVKHYLELNFVFDILHLASLILIMLNIQIEIFIGIAIISCWSRENQILQIYSIRYFEIIGKIVRISIIANYMIWIWNIFREDQSYTQSIYQVISILSLNAQQIDLLDQQQEILYIIYMISSIILWLWMIQYFCFNNQAMEKTQNKQPKKQNQTNKEYLIKQFPKYNVSNISFKEIKTTPNQNIIQEQQQDECSLYIIKSGEFIVQLQGRDIALAKDSFGEYGFYTGFLRQASVMSVGEGQLLEIKRDDFIRTLNQIDKERFYHRKELMIHQHFMGKCFCCSQQTHFIRDCPQLFFKPNIERIIKSFLYNGRQLRQNIKRREKRSRKAYELYLHQEEIMQWQSENKIASQSQYSLPYDENQLLSQQQSMTSFRSLSKQQDRSLLRAFSKQASNSNFLGFEQDHEFSAIPDTDEFTQQVNLVRSDNQKRTFATAGFGNKSMQSSMQDKTHNVELDVVEESLEKASESFTEEKDLFQQITRKNDPKLTFNQNFDQQMEMKRSSRQNSSRQHSAMHRSHNLTNQISFPRQNSIRSNRSLTYTSINKAQVSPPQAIKSGSSVENPEFMKSMNRISSRKHSTKTGTKISMLPSNFQPFSGFENVASNLYYGIIEFERMQEFEIYQPQNNYKIVIKKTNMRKKGIIKLSKYFLSYQMGVKILNLKQKHHRRTKD